MTLILGIDPGSRVTGYGVINVVGKKQQFVSCGCVRTKADDFSVRLKQIYSGLVEVIENYCPQEVAIEQIFMAKSATSALKLGHARGVALLAAANHDLPIWEFAAREVKLSVVGYGAATKAQVQHMVTQILSLPKQPVSDAADALAMALCHANTRNQQIRMAGAGSKRRRQGRWSPEQVASAQKKTTVKL